MQNASAVYKIAEFWVRGAWVESYLRSLCWLSPFVRQVNRTRFHMRTEGAFR